MFSLNDVTLRPLELDDIDTLYVWEATPELEMYGGWGPKRGRAAFRQFSASSKHLSSSNTFPGRISQNQFASNEL